MLNGNMLGAICGGYGVNYSEAGDLPDFVE